MDLMALMYVAFGGAFGAMCRYGVVSWVDSVKMSEFPYGTFAVNVLGCFLMGVWIAVASTMLPAKAKDLHMLFAVGVLGGFTTFSAFSMDVFLLLERGLLMEGAFYIIGSVVLSVLALMAGMWCLRMIAG